MSICTTCGIQLPAQARFCGICGTQLRPLPPSSQIPPRMPIRQGAPQLHAIPTMQGRPPLVSSTAPARFSQPASGHLAAGHRHPVHTQTNQAHDAETRTKVARNPANVWIALAIIIIVITVASAGGILASVLMRPHPQPIISVSSIYSIGEIPAGAKGTTLHILGQKFSSASAITFLLDGRLAPGAPHMLSDQNGNLSADLPITSAWSSGQHVITARDASHYISKKGVAIEVVVQGQANTPGPNGAPPDDASFSMSVSVQGQNAPVQEQYNGSNGSLSSTDPLAVTKQASSAEGSVCKARDDRQAQTYNGTTTGGLSDTQVATFSCSGTYKSGQISYTETLLSDVVTVSYQGDSYVCRLLTPGVDEQLTGSYTTSGSFSGTITYSSFPQSDFSCTTGQLSYFNFSLAGGNGTWSATDTLS